jgi:hypothetical protein
MSYVDDVKKMLWIAELSARLGNVSETLDYVEKIENTLNRVKNKKIVEGTRERIKEIKTLAYEKHIERLLKKAERAAKHGLIEDIRSYILEAENFAEEYKKIIDEKVKGKIR